MNFKMEGTAGPPAFVFLDEWKRTSYIAPITVSYLLAVVGNSWAEGQAGGLPAYLVDVSSSAACGWLW